MGLGKPSTRKTLNIQLTAMISGLVFAIALGLRLTLLADIIGHGRYYLTVILWISATLTIINLVRWRRQHRRPPVPQMPPDIGHPSQKREHFRLKFDHPPRPVFVQKTDSRHPAVAFTCPVNDISETGIGLACEGVFVTGQTVQGEIIFDSGRTAPVNGVVLRTGRAYTSLRLHCTIDPPLLMAEQREHIAAQKAIGPRPAVGKTLQRPIGGSLPSHAPKGICRLKRP